MNHFKKIISSNKGSLKVLPILHSCSAYSFRTIIESQELLPNYCEVFKENFLYTYYGIPSYRQSFEGATGNPVDFPVCFVLEYSKIPDLIRLHPFDTGAFATIPDLREKYFHHKMQLEDFELDANILEAVKLVEKFYNNNENYCKNELQIKRSEIDLLNFEALCYLTMIEDRSKTPFDNRVSTIELIYDEKITLDNNSLIHIILPNAFMDKIEIVDTLRKEWGITNPDSYSTVRGNPIEYFGTIYNKYLDFMETKGLY